MKELVNKIDQLLPQTQCGECGYGGCLPYAEAIAQKTADINRCPPGGSETIYALAKLLQINAEPLLKDELFHPKSPAIAKIREDECIGCTKCIQACPVDAIVGATKLMHSIISTECTGCGLCVEPCPVDCIELSPVKEISYEKNKARARYHAKKIRELKKQHEEQQRYREKKQLAKNTGHNSQDLLAKQDYILQALARAQKKRHGQ